MIHSERFVLVNMNSLYKLLNRDNDAYTEDDIIKMLYENDLTAFKESLKI